MTCWRDNQLTCSSDLLGSRQPPLQIPARSRGTWELTDLPSALWGPGLGLLGGHSTATLSVGPGDLPCLPYCLSQPTWTEINVAGAKGHLWWS